MGEWLLIQIIRYEYNIMLRVRDSDSDRIGGNLTQKIQVLKACHFKFYR